MFPPSLDERFSPSSGVRTRYWSAPKKGEPMTASPQPQSPRRRVLPTVLTAVLCVASLLILQERSASAALPAPVMRGYVPLEANATQETMENVSVCRRHDARLHRRHHQRRARRGACTTTTGRTGSRPTSPTRRRPPREIWGDGDAANGNAADRRRSAARRAPETSSPPVRCSCCGTTSPLPRTSRRPLRRRRPGVVDPRLHHHRRRVHDRRSGRSSPSSASAYDTSKWGTDYWIPVGENMTAPSARARPSPPPASR